STQEERMFRPIFVGPGREANYFLTLFPLETSPNDQYQLQLEATAVGATTLAIEVLSADGTFVRLEPQTNLGPGKWEQITSDLGQELYATPSISEMRTGPSAQTAAVTSHGNSLTQIKHRFPSDVGPVYLLNYVMYREGKKETVFKVGDIYLGEI